jgi:chorismate mutase
MTPTGPSLDDLRNDIDRIDEALHDLLVERVATVEAIRARKSGGPILYPAREAGILRRLADRHRGPLPFGVVARIWRELISAVTHLQHPLNVAVLAPEDQPGLWDLARDHFGSHLPMTAYRTAGQVIRAVTEGSAAVGVLSWPGEAEPGPWWPQLMSRAPEAPKIIARLPIAGRGNARNSGEALVIAGAFAGAPSPDRSLWALELPPETSRARLGTGLQAVGLEGRLIAVAEGSGAVLALFELVGTPGQDDPRFAALLAQIGTPSHRIHALGGYAEPILIP